MYSMYSLLARVLFAVGLVVFVVAVAVGGWG